jgi:hypothetical protein
VATPSLSLGAGVGGLGPPTLPGLAEGAAAVFGALVEAAMAAAALEAEGGGGEEVGRWVEGRGGLSRGGRVLKAGGESLWLEGRQDGQGSQRDRTCGRAAEQPVAVPLNTAVLNVVCE